MSFFRSILKFKPISAKESRSNRALEDLEAQRNSCLIAELDTIENDEIYDFFSSMVTSRNRWCDSNDESMSIPNGDKTFFMVVAPEEGYVSDGVFAPIGNKASFFSSSYQQVCIEADEATVGLYSDYYLAEEARLNLMEYFEQNGMSVDMKYQPIDFQTAINVIGSFGAHISVQFDNKRVIVPFEIYRNLIDTEEGLVQSFTEISNEAQIFSQRTGINIVDSDIIHRCISPLAKAYCVSLEIAQNNPDSSSSELIINIREKNIPIALCKQSDLDLLTEELQYQICSVDSQISSVRFSYTKNESVSHVDVCLDPTSLNNISSISR